MKSVDKISLYIHIPFCEKKCDYCAFYSVPVKGWDCGRYLKCLLAELDSFEFCPDIFRTVYIGGGSPSCLPRDEFMCFLQNIAKRVGNKEFTVEVNPAQVDEKALMEFRTAKVNRLSIGVQSFIQRELDLLTRNYSVGQITEVYRNARLAGFGNISLDLIFALPGSSIDDWEYNLEKVIELEPEHVSAYSLSYEKGTPFYKKIVSGELTPVCEDIDRGMYELTIDKLSQAGIFQYEISNFAKEGFQCKHNMSYWRSLPYIGIGAGAASFFGGKRWENAPNLEVYMREMEASGQPQRSVSYLSADELAAETAVLMLRTRFGVDFDEYYNRTGLNFQKVYSGEINRHLEAGNLIIERNRAYISRNSLAIADSILCDFSMID